MEWEWTKDNTLLVCRLAMWLICTFLRMVWGGGKGYSPSVRAGTQPDTTVGTVRFCTLYTNVFFRSKSRLCPFYILVWYLLWVCITQALIKEQRVYGSSRVINSFQTRHKLPSDLALASLELILILSARHTKNILSPRWYADKWAVI